MNPEDFIITEDKIDTYMSDYMSDLGMDGIDIAGTHSEIEIQEINGETIKVAATIRQQTYEIEALTDIIKEMVKTKNFDVELNIEKRVEQKKFLKKLGE